jgi:hypothetical protein
MSLPAGAMDALELCSNVSMAPAGNDIDEYYQML